ncbi:hypothetical protein WMY93_026998 [Mugilogobius chulae]|uniref:C1q domain-containing protein n=1 Tax=Mugilogobius chulae TaxID=88201 RepID=A0AAW0MVV5_9GOBI
MKAVLSFTLFFLTCSSLSGAETSLNLSENPQPCLSDIHAALRDMSNKLGEYKVRLAELETQNHDQTAKLLEMDKHATEMEQLKKHVQEHGAELKSIKAMSITNENHVADLRKDKAVGQIAFSASLLASGYGFVGPYSTHIPLVFRHLVTNTGNAYNSDTGFFTAPVRGVYHFEVHVGGESHAAGAFLTMNQKHIFGAYEQSPNGVIKSSNGANLLLEVGDVVSVTLWPRTKVFDNEYHHTTFSGHLLFTV